jgi:hypothetical protein
MTADALPEQMRTRWVAHSQSLLNSYRERVGLDLFDRSGHAADEAERLFLAPFVVVSHGVEADPILNYGNRAALELWEMSAETLAITPSRLTAEAMLHEARERLLTDTARRGFVSGYEGIRISAAGRRFRILDVTIWNVNDASGRAIGQAATFAHWAFL